MGGGGGVLIQAWFEKADTNSKPDSNPVLDFRLDPDPHIMNTDAKHCL